MKNLILSMFALLLSMSSFAKDWSDFNEFKAEYFSKLDYFEPHIAKDIPALERKLIKLSDEILAKPEQTQTKEDANFLAYTALYILNTKGGFFAGTISLDDLDQKQTFTTSKVLTDVHLARHQHVVKLLEESNRIDPKHRLVPYWLLGSQFSLALLENREPTDEQLKGLVKQAGNSAFGFFNTYITMKEVNMNESVDYRNPLLDKALDKAAFRMLTLTLDKSEGMKEDAKENKKFVPYMILGSLTALGEYFAVRSTEMEGVSKFKAKKFKAFSNWALLYTRVPLIPGFKMYKWDRLKDKRDLQKFVTYFGSKKVSDENKSSDPHKLNAKTTLKIMSCAACHSSPKL